MARKLNKVDENLKESPVLDTVKDSAGQIWLAGLGAFAMTQEGSAKLFETLVKEGEAAQQRTVKVAEESAVGARDTVVKLRRKAAGQWDRMEKVFEDRVARALHRLGVPTREDIQELMARVEELNANITALTEAKKPAARKRIGGSSEQAA
jgi:poly(hydroxyalkanoate) granule-associated protein